MTDEAHVQQPLRLVCRHQKHGDTLSQPAQNSKSDDNNINGNADFWSRAKRN
jgi:hypothetical protein